MRTVTAVWKGFSWQCLDAAAAFERMRGLLGRDDLPEGMVMRLCPCGAVHTFGMRFTLDVVFLDASGKVLRVRRGMRRGRIAFGGFRSVAALEARSGWLPDIVPGDTVEIR